MFHEKKLFLEISQNSEENTCARVSFSIKSIEPVVQRFCRKCILRNFAKFTGKHLFQGLYFNKVAGLGLACKFIEKEALAQVFSVNFAKFLKTPFLQNTSERLLLCFITFCDWEFLPQMLQKHLLL